MEKLFCSYQLSEKEPKQNKTAIYVKKVAIYIYVCRKSFLIASSLAQTADFPKGRTESDACFFLEASKPAVRRTVVTHHAYRLAQLFGFDYLGELWMVIYAHTRHKH